MAEADVARLVALLTERELTVATCESLTAGLVSARIADVPGASLVLRGALVTYSPELKVSLAGVPAEAVAKGVVTRAVAEAMARGARHLCQTDWGLSTTGVAGPGPADGVPAGTVWVAVAGPLGTVARELSIDGDRAAVRAGAVDGVLALVLEQLG